MSTPNFLQMLHLRNIFGNGTPPLGNDLPSQGGITGNMPAVPNAPTDLGTPTFNSPKPAFGPDPMNGGSTPIAMNNPSDDIAAQMNRVYNPHSKAEDRLNQMLDQFPTREKPGMLRRIAAVGGALGGDNPDDILYPHFNEQMQDWKTKIGPATSAAQIERASNVNERTMAHQTIANQLRQEALTAKMNNDSRRADIAEKRAKIYQFKAEHPEMQILMPKGGNITAVDRITGETHDLGVDTGTMTDDDKLQFNRDTTMQGIGARGDETRKTAETKGDIVSGQITQRGDEARKTKTTPGANTNRTELPTQTRVRIFNRANQARIEHPEWASYITISGNEVKVKTPGRFSGPDAKTYKAISDFLEGNTASTPTEQAPPAGAKPGGKWTDTKFGKVYQEP